MYEDDYCWEPLNHLELSSATINCTELVRGPVAVVLLRTVPATPRKVLMAPHNFQHLVT
jgi:hypothetical protein